MGVCVMGEKWRLCGVVSGAARVLRERRGSLVLFAGMILASALAGCATAPQMASKGRHSKEYFAESKYGVKASPRLYRAGQRMPHGGGRYQVGQPYMVKGRWYYPKEYKHYTAIGRASWYGDAFHGRLTANGEVYDTMRLTAAHPTMPLPSYARVTNMANGSSVIVRVNDRGPYERNRVIDLSEKAAEMLDYQHHGTAKVKVEYVGRAPLEGNDEPYLLASYRPGNGDMIGQPATGVMLAMNEPTPPAPKILPRVARVACEPVPRPMSVPSMPRPPLPRSAMPKPDVPRPALAAMPEMPAMPKHRPMPQARMPRPAALPVPKSLPFAVNPAYGPTASIDRDRTVGHLPTAHAPKPSHRPGLGVANAEHQAGFHGMTAEEATRWIHSRKGNLARS